MKKLLKLFPILPIAAAICFTFASCGYNTIMRRHLSDPENYYTFILQIEKIQAYYPKSDKYFKDVTCASDIDIESLDSISLWCKMLDSSGEEFEYFFDDNKICRYFHIIKPNAEVLLKNGFFNTSETGDVITVKSTFWIYMDGYFCYISEIISGDKVYLQFDEGLKNIVNYMEQHKGL